MCSPCTQHSYAHSAYFSRLAAKWPHLAPWDTCQPPSHPPSVLPVLTQLCAPRLLTNELSMNLRTSSVFSLNILFCIYPANLLRCPCERERAGAPCTSSRAGLGCLILLQPVECPRLPFIDSSLVTWLHDKATLEGRRQVAAASRRRQRDVCCAARPQHGAPVLPADTDLLS
jgi:hypothetical protein